MPIDWKNMADAPQGEPVLIWGEWTWNGDLGRVGAQVAILYDDGTASTERTSVNFYSDDCDAPKAWARIEPPQAQ